jgi:hypothetical protein
MVTETMDKYGALVSRPYLSKVIMSFEGRAS